MFVGVYTVTFVPDTAGDSSTDTFLVRKFISVIVFTSRFSGPGRAIGQVCVYVSMYQDITFLLSDLTPRYLAWFQGFNWVLPPLDGDGRCGTLK